MAVRQFAINEFDVRTEKYYKEKFRGFYKFSDDCTWKINGSKHKGKITVEVNIDKYLIPTRVIFIICLILDTGVLCMSRH